MRTTRRLGLLLTTLLVALLATTPTGAVAAPTADAPPGPVTGLTLTPLRDGVGLAWTLPPDADLAEVVVRRAAGTTAPATPTDGTQVASGLLTQWSDTGLDFVDTWSYSVFAHDAAGQWSAPVSVTGATLDLPGASLTHSTTASQVSLEWGLPTDERVAGLRIARIGCSDPWTETSHVDVPRPTSSWADTGLSPGVQYCYDLRTYDQDGRTQRTPRRAAFKTLFIDPVTDLTATVSGTTVSLRWTLPTNPAPAEVVVWRQAPSSSPVEVYRGRGTSVVNRNLLPEQHYLYTANAMTADGKASPLASVGATTVHTWTRATVAPMTGSPQHVQCPRTSWCLSTDASNRYQVLGSSGWSSPVAIDPAVESGPTELSCPVVGWCLAASADGVRQYTRSAWQPLSSVPQPPAGTTVTALTCTSPTWCVAMTTGPRATVYDGTRWSAPTYLSSLRGVDFLDVSCQVAGRCFAVGRSATSGSAWRASLVSGRWSTAALDTAGRGVDEVDCPTSSFCIASSAYGTWTVAGTTWSAKRAASTSNAERAVTCASASTCIGIDGGGRGVRWNGSSWGSATRFVATGVTLTSLSCPKGATPCTGVDDRGGDYRWSTAAGWRRIGTFDLTSGGLTRVSCPSATSCMAMDQRGWFYRFDGTSWRSPSKPLTGPAELDCAASGFCLAVESMPPARYRTLSSAGTWSSVRALSGASQLGSPHCYSSTLCMVIDIDGRAWQWNGTSLVLSGTPFSGTADGGWDVRVRCTSATFCIAVSNGGWWSRWNGTTWRTRAHLPGALAGAGTVVMDCATGSMCLAVVDSGATARYDGRDWTELTLNGRTPGARLADLSCSGVTTCLAVHPYTNTTGPVRWTGDGWEDAGPYGRETYGDSVDCPTARRCVVVGPVEALWTVDPAPVG
ncbi:fibronectin type III domain-containing protein [Phycicoccus sp. MAQZ13P-2]|uniref:fibronectin type III domain-containing protein n=1 Tax=Phycicoccus mangrovi TaxID=2840470 RepID=UPI001C003459|nr:fibronectin type III domain-containing protein [Phycicoccus mangrovi]MBT9254909.1 fibronectin type III domain-containing protein [Phycicoccus mangrovi]MBT9256094.1 fibronectin type III domain-containing protein [Phycicoccus mangrovi]MBT9273893.1 fibronectin type III domain-containing protein [Phycicoccus mangrovi]